jgi:hypothetical protein
LILVDQGTPAYRQGWRISTNKQHLVERSYCSIQPLFQNIHNYLDTAHILSMSITSSCKQWYSTNGRRTNIVCLKLGHISETMAGWPKLLTFLRLMESWLTIHVSLERCLYLGDLMPASRPFASSEAPSVTLLLVEHRRKMLRQGISRSYQTNKHTDHLLNTLGIPLTQIHCRRHFQ